MRTRVHLQFAEKEAIIFYWTSVIFRLFMVSSAVFLVWLYESYFWEKIIYCQTLASQI